jgi:hypothetical protein
MSFWLTRWIYYRTWYWCKYPEPIGDALFRLNMEKFWWLVPDEHHGWCDGGV